MPLYEYQCEKCGDVFEVMQKFSDAPLTAHEKCGGPVHRLISAPALQFKGSGWYITDYARSSKPDGNGASAKGDTAEKKEAAGNKESSSTPAVEKTSSPSAESRSSSSETK